MTKCSDCKAELEQVVVTLYGGTSPFFAYVCPNSEVYQLARIEKKLKTAGDYTLGNARGRQ